MRRPSAKFLFCSVGLAALCLSCVIIGLYVWSSRKANHRSAFPTYSQIIKSNDPKQILAEADRLALLANWTKAGPLFARAEQIYSQQGDERNALCARIGRLRSDVEKTSYSEVGRAISEEMKNPLVKNDARLKLRCLTAKGVIDMNINTPDAKKDWTEVLALAKSLEDGVWQERATGWLGILAFIDGKTARAGGMVTHWWSCIRKVFKLALVDQGHPHRFRDTFAVDLLLQGVPLERVSVLLGHKSIKVTEKHYAPWIRARQEQLEADVKRVWESHPETLGETNHTYNTRGKTSRAN